ncbi:MAG TPA: methylenetetrahydrofolate reductase [NAD(P)H] [Elusimicrobiota bacterium]|nr:methylenetetrahydrofolate reductase [NAD(P)H] [Elusimicrobiota bacterium]
MKISELIKTVKPSFSFEFFPPKTDDDVAQLMQTARDLRTLDPTFISVTWGAGGGTQRKTIDTVSAIKTDLRVESMAHLTCVGASSWEISAVLDELQKKGVENILALRGDPPRDHPYFVPHPDGFRHANELVAHIRQGWKFCIGVAGYPEGHVECPDKELDLRNLKQKVDAGADFVVTQLFFDNTVYFKFVERARAIGIQAPILAGIMPVTNAHQIKRFTTSCGATLPPALLSRLEAHPDDKAAVVQIGIDHAAQQCAELLRGGAPGIHFYTMNRSHSTTEILRRLRRS